MEEFSGEEVLPGLLAAAQTRAQARLDADLDFASNYAREKTLGQPKGDSILLSTGIWEKLNRAHQPYPVFVGSRAMLAELDRVMQAEIDRTGYKVRAPKGFTPRLPKACGRTAGIFSPSAGVLAAARKFLLRSPAHGDYLPRLQSRRPGDSPLAW